MLLGQLLLLYFYIFKNYSGSLLPERLEVSSSLTSAHHELSQ